MKYTIKMHEVELKTIEGEVMESHELHKAVANLMYRFAQDLDLVEIAMKMNRGEEVELTASQIKELKRLIVSKESVLASFSKKAAIEYLEVLLKEES
jgi:hypothetical protein